MPRGWVTGTTGRMFQRPNGQQSWQRPQNYWHCPHSMQSTVYVMVVCPITGLQQQQQFVAERHAGRRCQSTAAGAQQQQRRSTVLSSKCGQCHVDSWVDEAGIGILVIGIPSPTHSFTLGLNPSFSANPPYHSLSFFSFRIHYMDIPDCLLLLLSISVFLVFFLFLHFFSCRFRAVD